jgi:hypothetical protein
LVTTKSTLETLSEEDLMVIDDILECLRPFADITKEFSGKKYTTMSLVIPNVNILLGDLKLIKTKTQAGEMLLSGLVQRTEERLLKYETRTTAQ